MGNLNEMRCKVGDTIGPYTAFFPQHNYSYPFGWYMFGIGTLTDEKSIIS